MTEINTIVKGEDKLIGVDNYPIWSLKMRSFLRSESLWEFTEAEMKPASFPITIEGEQLSEAVFRKRKALACRLILWSVANQHVGLVADITDPAESWKKLKDQFSAGSNSQILTLMSQLQTLMMSEGTSVEDHIGKVRDLRDRLSNLGEKLSDRHLC